MLYFATMMRKFLFFVMAVVVFQFSWIAIGAYCGHESGQAAQHFGHHQHVESADELMAMSKDKSSVSGKKFASHAHCSYCSHATLASVSLEAMVLCLLPAAASPVTLVSTLSSAYLPPPERPQWTVAV